MNQSCDFVSVPVLVRYLEELSQEFYDLHPLEVPVIEGAPLPFDFSRNWLSQNIPVLFKGAVRHWPALSKWNNEYLRSELQDKKVSVAVTPNGYADAVYNNKFLLPEERFMTFSNFVQTLENPKSPVYYVQKQNNNLPEEFSSLQNDVEHHIPWATEAMCKKPEAVNFWMGDGRAVTSLHKDHYENIYCVVKGKKEFILHCPIDAPWIPYENYDVAVYKVDDEKYSTSCLNQKIKWIPVDPLNPDYEKYPLYKKARKIHCTVEEGDAFYLPSLWFHHVRQSHGCIAVNYWYDMDFNARYCHFKFLEKMSCLLHRTC